MKKIPKWSLDGVSNYGSIDIPFLRTGVNIIRPSYTCEFRLLILIISHFLNKIGCVHKSDSLLLFRTNLFQMYQNGKWKQKFCLKWKKMALSAKIIRDCGVFLKKVGQILHFQSCFHHFRHHLISDTELYSMRTLGDTLKGPDPLPQQLEELDAQSRLMLGF